MAALIVSLPPTPLIVRRSLAPSAPVMLTWARGRRPTRVVPAPITLIDVAAVGAVDDHRVGRGVAGVPPIVAARLTSTCVHVGAAQVVDRDGVGAAERR